MNCESCVKCVECVKQNEINPGQKCDVCFNEIKKNVELNKTIKDIFGDKIKNVGRLSELIKKLERLDYMNVTSINVFMIIDGDKSPSNYNLMFRNTINLLESFTIFDNITFNEWSLFTKKGSSNLLIKVSAEEIEDLKDLIKTIV